VSHISDGVVWSRRRVLAASTAGPGTHKERLAETSDIGGNAVNRRVARRASWLVVVSLCVGLLALPAGASAPRQANGVTKDEIQVVLMLPDIDAIIRRGIDVGNISNEAFAARFKSYVDAFGPINGRKVKVDIVSFDVLDPTDFDRACTRATIDMKPFVVVNGSGYRDSSIPCIAIDNKTPFMTGDMIGGQTQKAAGKNLVALALPPEVAAKNAARLVDETKQLPKNAKIGILSNDIPAPKLAGEVLGKELKKRGYNVVSTVLAAGLVGNPGQLRTTTGQAALTFQSKGVDTVFNVQSFNPVPTFFSEASKINYKPKMFAVDGQSTTCTINGVARFEVPQADITCISGFDSGAGLDGKGIHKDNAFEAKCRSVFNAARNLDSHPGAPSAGKTVNGVKYDEDFPYNECMLANLLLPAMKKAGKDLTWDKVYKNIMAVKKGPAAYMSGGEGGFSAKRPYYVNKMQFLKFQYANADTPKNPDGTFAGCPIPVPCLIPQTVDGHQWFPIK
jgi:hypothetical protein